ncbi:MAG: glycosyltransferase [Candidatus Kerfeldbacteria bacterium]|nr:glycosyltransferase [Candidatus Kerfeldbacteria bacterium]
MIHRTLVITHLFPPPIGGVEQYLEQLVRGLPGEQLIVVAPPSPGDEDFDRTVPAIVIRRDLHRGWLTPTWLAHLPWLIRVIQRHRITRLVFGHYAGSVGLGMVARWLLGRPYVVGIFGLDFYAYRTTIVRRVLLRLALRGAEWVVTNSTFTARLVTNFGVPSGKVVVSFPGVNQPPTTPSTDVNQFRQRLGLDGKKILLTVGRLIKRKGHARIIRALPTILASVPELRYLIVGDGPERPLLERLVRECSLQDVVQFLGAIPNDQRILAYRLADAFIMLPVTSNVEAEGFGIVYLEALSAGVPIIATRSGGVNDIIRHEVNGLALDEQADASAISQAITRLLTDQALARRLGQQGRQLIANHFSIRQQVKVFEAMLEQPPTKPSQPPTVSVVIPTYNSAITLPRTLHSLAVQTWKDLEVLVVDDGSADHPDVVGRRFPSVRYVSQPHAGAAAARNHGFRESRGSLVLFCDADVTLHPRMIERMVTTLSLKPEAAYAYCSFRFGWRTFDLFDFDADRLKETNYISTMSLIRREAFPGFDESLVRLQDWDLWLTMLEHGHRGVWVPARLFSTSTAGRGISRRITAPPAAAVARVKRKHGLA